MKAISILSIGALAAIIPGCLNTEHSASATGERYPWKKNIVTTVFWVGEQPSGNNPVPNRISSWDEDWSRSYGGFDDPNPAHRSNYMPVKFTPRQNPFYCALPYNDKSVTGHRPEAPRIVPWFREAYQGPGVSTCKGRWVMIRKGDRTVYAQWEDAGPFRTDHWQYVFGNERPKPNLNKGAGLDVSPAVRDYLGLQDTDVPGVHRKITVEDLPPPSSNRFSISPPHEVRRPEGAQLQVPSGFKIAMFARGLQDPRFLLTAPNGDIFVVESRADRIKVLR